jgi:hypothetical protein
MKNGVIQTTIRINKNWLKAPFVQSTAYGAQYARRHAPGPVQARAWPVGQRNIRFPDRTQAVHGVAVETMQHSHNENRVAP